MNAKLSISVTDSHAATVVTVVEPGGTINPAIFADTAAVTITVLAPEGELVTPAWNVVCQRSGL